MTDFDRFLTAVREENRHVHERLDALVEKVSAGFAICHRCQDELHKHDEKLIEHGEDISTLKHERAFEAQGRARRTGAIMFACGALGGLIQAAAQWFGGMR